MRNLFIVAAKILGLYLFCDIVKKLPDAVLRVYSSSLINNESQRMFVESRAAVLSLVILLVLACLLVFKTGWVADKAGLAENKESPVVNRNDLLAAGLKLLGLYLAGILFFHIVIWVVFLLARAHDPYVGISMGFNVLNTFSSVVTLVLAMLFLFKTNAMVDMLTRVENVSWRKVVFATLIALGVMLGITIADMLYRPQYPYPYPLNWDNDIGIIGGEDGPTTIYTSSRFWGDSEPVATNELHAVPTQDLTLPLNF